MKIISHRGNLSGRIPELENHPEYVEKAIKNGFDVEVDLWAFQKDLAVSEKDNLYELFLGHDHATYKIEIGWLIQRRRLLWIHAKNDIAAKVLSSHKYLNWFWHESDEMTLTSNGTLWMYPGKYMNNGITVVLGPNAKIPESCGGICTDNPTSYL